MFSRPHCLIAGAALAWLASSCTVVSSPPPRSPSGEPPPAAAQPPQDYPDEYPPEQHPDEPRHREPAAEAPREPIARNEPPPPPRRRDHRTPTEPVSDAPPPQRRNRYVPVRGKRPAAEFQIEPTAGPVGTTVTIYGDYRRAMRAGNVQVGFEGVRRPAKPLYVATDRLTVVVPNGARTGAVQVQAGRRELWRGSFAVTGRDQDLFIPIDEGNGLLGAVYKLPANTKKLPNFDNLGTPHATIVVPALHVAPRRFETGFPGLDASGEPLLEWFGIRFVGQIDVPTTSRYGFRLNSDDGSRLYIDNQLVVENDGVHAPRAKEGGIDLTAGTHDIVVEYFQGPRFQIALELLWQREGGWVHVPAEALSRHTGYDCSSEPEIMCCQGNSAACRSCKRNAREVVREWRRTCQGGGPPGAGNPSPGNPGPGNPGTIDCASKPERVCCQGQAAQCVQCRQQARAERTEWQQQCRGRRPGAGNPSRGNPGTVDCASPPQRMCCQAQTAQCGRCRQQAAAERAEWQQQCGGARPGAGNPGAVDCSSKPERVCCQGQAAQCVQCRRQARAERAAWQQQCVSTQPVEEGADDVDCSEPPRAACCKALTPRCRDCQRQARAARAQWERQCRRR